MRNWIIGGLALLCAHSPAYADYIYDPEHLPAGFECDADWNEQRCADETRYEAWYEKYSYHFDYWFNELLFNTNVYFAKKGALLPPHPDWEEGAPEPEYETAEGETPNLVDATHSIALQRHSDWAFAVDEKARLRIVTIQYDDEIDPAILEKQKELLPTTLAEAAELLKLGVLWEQADLTQCKGAIEHLLNFPTQRSGAFWSEKELQWAPGFVPKNEADGRFVTADGDGVSVRARSVEDVGSPRTELSAGFVFYDQSNGGAGYDWAKEMEVVVRPCLKPSDAPPPWEKVLAANPGEKPTTP